MLTFGVQNNFVIIRQRHAEDLAKTSRGLGKDKQRVWQRYVEGLAETCRGGSGS